MTVSVIIPFRKGLFFLADCLDSLMEQSYKEMEIILVCDRVEEDLDSFLKPYQELREIKVYTLEDKKGVAAARNLGLSVATGDYIYFLDSDDYLEADTIERLVNTAIENDSDIVYGKKNWTWFRRELYLRKLYNEDSESEEGEETDSLDSEDTDQEHDDNEDSEDSVSEEQSHEDTDDDEEHTEDHDDNAADTGSLDEEERMALEQESLLQKQNLANWELVGRRKSLRGVTVLHILMRRSLIIDNNIWFNERITYLSDYPFLLQVLAVAERFDRNMEAIYAKRKHNDAINYPALSQKKGSKSFSKYVWVYEYAKTLIDPASSLRRLLDRKVIMYCIRYYAPKLIRKPLSQGMIARFDTVHSLISQMDKNLLASYKGYRRRILKAMYQGNIKRSSRIVFRHLAWLKLKKMLKNKRVFYKFLYRRFFLKKSMKDNWVFCESFFGKSYSDSPKYVYEYVQKNYPGKYRFIWVINKKHTVIPYKHKKVRRFSIGYVYYLARCKYYIFNGRQPEWVVKRSGNVFLQTWHGTPLKKLVFDIEDINSATPRYKNQTYRQSRAWDYLIAANQFSSTTFRRCFKYEKTMLETGYPRNDIMHYPDRDRIAQELKAKLGIPADKKTILYAPTWRDDEYYVKGQYKFKLQLDLNLMREKMGKDYVILLRTHYFIADKLDVTGVEDFAYNFSDYDDISELYLISDYLITDYSSVFFDYANLKRPMLFYTYDLEKYRDILRGFYIDIEEELPGPLLFTTEEVIDAFEHIDEIAEKYRDKYKVFYEKYCSWEDGQASKRVAEAVFPLK